jgi:hypothetical protein
MAKELITTKPLSAFSVNAARVSLSLGVLYSVLLLSLHVIKPELDPTWNFISEYALGKFGWLMTVTFLALAGSQISLFFAIRTQVKTVIGYIGLFLLVLSAIGILITALFQTDPITTDQGAMTQSGTMHVIGASLDWTPFAALFISLSLARTKVWSIKKRSMLITAAITIILTIVFIATVASAPDGKFGPGVYAGLVGRFLIWSYLGWIATVALHIIRADKLREISPSILTPIGTHGNARANPIQKT